MITFTKLPTEMTVIPMSLPMPVDIVTDAKEKPSPKAGEAGIGRSVFSSLEGIGNGREGTRPLGKTCGFL
jgi:hypothetical protein